MRWGWLPIRQSWPVGHRVALKVPTGEKKARPTRTGVKRLRCAKGATPLAVRAKAVARAEGSRRRCSQAEEGAGARVLRLVDAFRDPRAQSFPATDSRRSWVEMRADRGEAARALQGAAVSRGATRPVVAAPLRASDQSPRATLREQDSKWEAPPRQCCPAASMAGPRGQSRREPPGLPADRSWARVGVCLENQSRMEEDLPCQMR